MESLKQGQIPLDDLRIDEKKTAEVEVLDERSSDPAIDPETGEYKLVRQLKNRHISLIRYLAFSFLFALYSPHHSLVSEVLLELVYQLSHPRQSLR